jgi:hypothetical protein
MPDEGRDPTGVNRPETTGGANEGGFPSPGGETETNDINPQSHEEGRTTGPNTNESTKERTESVERQL